MLATPRFESLWISHNLICLCRSLTASSSEVPRSWWEGAGARPSAWTSRPALPLDRLQIAPHPREASAQRSCDTLKCREVLRSWQGSPPARCYTDVQM